MKKLLSFLIIFSVLFSFDVKSFNKPEVSNEIVNIIIETYTNDVNEYKKIHSEIKEINKDISDINYIYTDVFYGFSLSTSGSFIPDIKKLNKVKNIYISKEYTVPEITPSEDAYTNKTKGNINLFSDSETYNGKGTVVAVLDSEFRLNHECFSSLPSQTKITKNYMNTIFSNNILHCEENADITYESTWYSDKIPYFYDYGEKDLNTTGKHYHGTSVASLIGGNSSNLSNFATQTQLALFKVSDKNGEITTEYVLAALDDAYKIKVDAVNISFGDTAGFVNNWSGYADELNFSIVSTKFKEAGIPVFTATGNSSNAGNVYYGGKYYSLAENPDIGTLSSYASQKNVVASGALKYSSSSSPSVADYSSTGATNDLRIAPDLTFYGNTKYAYGSSSSNYKTGEGTSFSTPLLCGIYLACKEYYKDAFPDISDNDLNNLIEQALMSTASLVRYNNVPVSPRQQGAGYPDINTAISTPVVLTGSDNKTKINIFEINDNTFSFKFTAKNISQSSETYSLSAEFITDNYKKINDKYINYMTPYLLKDTVYSFDLGNTVTLNPGEAKEITVSATLPEEIINEYQNIFTNGLFIEGYIYLTPNDTSYPDLHIPFMAFKGEWDKAPVFDIDNVYNFFGFYYNDDDDLNLYKSGKIYVNPETSSWRMGVLRNIRDFSVDAVQGNTLKNRLTASNLFRKNYYYQGNFNYKAYYATSLLKPALSEGEYKLIYRGNPEYDGSETQVYYQNVVIDKTAPEIAVKRTVKNNRVYLELKFKDNCMLDYFVIEQYKDGIKINDFEYIQTINKAESTIEYDITDAQYYNYKVTVYDYAHNQSSYIKDESLYTSYISGYNSDKSLVNVKLMSGILSLEDATDIANTFDTALNEIKYYVWEGLNPVIIPVKLK